MNKISIITLMIIALAYNIKASTKVTPPRRLLSKANQISGAVAGLKHIKSSMHDITNAIRRLQGPAEITAGLKAIDTAVDTTKKVVEMYHGFFKYFFDTTAIEEALTYLAKNKQKMYEYSSKNAAEVVTGLNIALSELLDIRRDILSMMDVVIGGIDSSRKFFNVVTSTDNGLNDERRARVFMGGLTTLNGSILESIKRVDSAIQRLNKVSTSMDALGVKTGLAIQDIENAKSNNSSFMKKKLEEFAQSKMIQCIEVCVGSALLGGLVVPICATCMQVHYKGKVEKYAKVLKDELDRTNGQMTQFQKKFSQYSKTAAEIKNGVQKKLDALYKYKSSAQQTLNDIAMNTELAKELPSSISILNDSLTPLRDAALKLKEEFSNHPSKKL